MKNRFSAILAIAVLMLSMLTACNKTEVLTDEQAQQIALEDAGLSDASVTDIHCHFGITDNVAQFEVHFTYEGQEYQYVIHGKTGQILSSNQ